MTDEIKKKHAGGPKKIVIDLEVLEKLLIMQATDEEIGAWFGLTKQGISWRNKTDPEFHRVYANGKNRGRASLRREMWKSAQGVAPDLLLDKMGQPVWDSKGKLPERAEASFCKTLDIYTDVLNRIESCDTDGKLLLAQLRASYDYLDKEANDALAYVSGSKAKSMKYRDWLKQRNYREAPQVPAK